jgi:hypothetical protein
MQINILTTEFGDLESTIETGRLRILGDKKLVNRKLDLMIESIPTVGKDLLTEAIGQTLADCKTKLPDMSITYMGDEEKDSWCLIDFQERSPRTHSIIDDALDALAGKVLSNENSIGSVVYKPSFYYGEESLF